VNAIRRAVALVVLGVGGVTACTVVAPTPLPTSSVVESPPGSIEPDPTVTPTTEPSPTPDPDTAGLLPFGRTLRIRSLPRDVTGPIYGFASTGSAVVFSTGDPDGEARPDLWRLTPGPDAVPELAWSNPNRDRTIAEIAGDLDTVAFADISISGDPEWDFWLLPEGGEAVLLDTFAGGEDISTYVPSFSIYEPKIVWAAFDRGADGEPVSQLLTASEPDWMPRVLAEARASEREFWFPSLYGDTFVYQEIVYAEDGLTDERHVYLSSLTADGMAPPTRLDATGLAVMPLVGQFGIVWKESEPGDHMLTWGVMRRYDAEAGIEVPMDTGVSEFVDFPSMGERFVTWNSVDRRRLFVHDLETNEPRGILRYLGDIEQTVIEVNLANSLLVWLEGGGPPGAEQRLRYAYLPGMREVIR